MSCYSLLLALHSPLLAGLLQEAGGKRQEAGLLGKVGQGQVGLTLPLPLNTIKALVAFLQEKAGEMKVKEEVKEAVDFLGMGVDEEGGLASVDTLEEELPSYSEYNPENIVYSKEDTKCANESLDTSEGGAQYNVLGKVKEAASDVGIRLQEECDSLVTVDTFEEELQSEWEDGKENMHMSKEDIMSDKNLKNDFEHQCSRCDQTFLNMTKLKQHIEDNHEGGKPKRKPDRTSCNECSRSFNNKQHLEKHMFYTHENTVNRLVPCSECVKELPILSMAQHERKCKMSDKERKEYKEKQKASCPECGKTLSCKEKLRRHIASVHNRGKKN